MLGNFTYCNPTKLYFGDKSLENLDAELANTAPTWRLYTAVDPSRSRASTIR